MGCDIHLFAEKKVNNKWKNIDEWKENKYYKDYPDEEEEFEQVPFYSGGRLYNLFSALAGVRSQSFNNPSEPISYPKGIPDDCDKLTRKEYDRYSSDAHSASYLTLSELKKYDWSKWGQTCNSFINEVIPKMEKHNTKEDDIRIVFFFDN